jgi:hypothetical protein
MTNSNAHENALDNSLLTALMKRFQANAGLVKHGGAEPHVHLVGRHTILIPMNNGNVNGGMKVLTKAGVVARDLLRYGPN